MDIDGNHYCLDLSNVDTGTCPVVFWDHDQSETQTLKIIGKTFSDWIAEHVTERAQSDASSRQRCEAFFLRFATTGFMPVGR